MTKNQSDYLIKKNNREYEVVIGLEVHAQVLSESKLFSNSPTKFGAEPNTQVSLVDAAFPGMLPVINEFCIKQAVKTGIGLNAKINKRSIFDRKNYFYADLPQGYQISQYKNPIVGEGSVVLDLPSGEKIIGIERLHSYGYSGMACSALGSICYRYSMVGKYTWYQSKWNGILKENYKWILIQSF